MKDTAAGLLAANKAVLNARGDYTRDLERLTADLPQNTYFTDVDIDDTQITIQGETDNVFTVIEYATALETEQFFHNVRIAQLNEKPNYAFPSENSALSDTTGIIEFVILINK